MSLKGKKIFWFDGPKLAEFLNRRTGSRVDLARAIGVSSKSLQNWENGVKCRVHSKSLEKIASFLGMTDENFHKEFSVELLNARGDLSANGADLKRLGITTGEKLPRPARRTDPSDIIVFPTVPVFFGAEPVAAGLWVELEKLQTFDVPAHPDQIFGIRVKGDSMQPQWPDGQTVLFQRMSKAQAAAAVGQDFLVIRNDNHATFKRLTAVEDDVFTLRAVNKKKYPKPLKVSGQEIALIAWARGVFTEPPRVEL